MMENAEPVSNEETELREAVCYKEEATGANRLYNTPA
jgi:hypothetical protein